MVEIELDVNKLGKELIEKGTQLNDPDLIEMGMKMMKKNDVPEYAVVRTATESAKYVCSNCQYEIEYDKPGRKKCPKCKKHTLKLIQPTKKENRVTAKDFETQVRQKNSTRIRYNDEGKPEGLYTKTEQIEGVTNVWTDDGTEGFDEVNEKLKRMTKVSPRTRKPVKYIEVVCENCKKTELVHPIHGGARGRYICDTCIKRRSRV